MITSDGQVILTGDIVPCPSCGEDFKYYIWSFGSDWYGCRKCRGKIDAQNPLNFIDDDADGTEAKRYKEMQMIAHRKETKA